jgi:hypothetical protein
LRDRIVRVTPNSTRAQGMKSEDKLKVDFWNRYIQLLGPETKVANVNPHLRKKEYRYR